MQGSPTFDEERSRLLELERYQIMDTASEQGSMISLTCGSIMWCAHRVNEHHRRPSTVVQIKAGRGH
ncbi:MAG: hypothetical protein ACI915_004875 [Gammaproteobacteria bacterium]|jgi:hypothetical protein